jgi:hypothetical protein
MMWQNAATNKQAKQVCRRAECAECAGVADNNKTHDLNA